VDPTRVDAPERVWTVPNIVSFIRLAGVPLFLYLFLVAHAEAAAVTVLAVGGTTDWVDGYLARRLGQVSKLGALLDPFADRLYILATLIAFTIAGVVPWLFAAALLLRELAVGIGLLVLRHYGVGPPEVHYVGKTATFLLLAGFPMLLLARASEAAAPIASASGWALAWWGLGLYWVAGGLYLAQIGAVIRAAKRAGPGRS
jgi:cardiolipin synthase